MSSESNESREAPALLRVDIVTLFPDMVTTAASASIVGRAQKAGKLDLHVHNPRDFAPGVHRQTDDTPFGGGAGMVMTCGPLFGAIDAALENAPENTPVLLMAPDGAPFTQAHARELSHAGRFVLVCGHYEGIDERVREARVTRAVSIGDYVLTGGELPALVVLDAATRLLPGVLGNAFSPEEETFGDADGLILEYPHYTRPAEFRGARVPDVLLSGHHANITAWRRQQSLVRTRVRRPDLWARLEPTLSARDRKLLAAHDDAEAG